MTTWTVMTVFFYLKTSYSKTAKKKPIQGPPKKYFDEGQIQKKYGVTYENDP